MPLAALLEGATARGEDVIAYDNLGASPGGLVGISEGREAANPFGRNRTPVDAFCACMIDTITLK